VVKSVPEGSRSVLASSSAAVAVTKQPQSVAGLIDQAVGNFFDVAIGSVSEGVTVLTKVTPTSPVKVSGPGATPRKSITGTPREAAPGATPWDLDVRKEIEKLVGVISDLHAELKGLLAHKADLEKSVADTKAVQQKMLRREAELLNELQTLRGINAQTGPGSHNPVPHDDRQVTSTPPRPGQPDLVSADIGTRDDYGEKSAGASLGKGLENGHGRDERPVCPSCALVQEECQRLRDECSRIVLEKEDLLQQLESCRQKLAAHSAQNWLHVEAADAEKWREQSDIWRAKCEKLENDCEKWALECEKMRAHQREAAALRAMVHALQKELDKCKEDVDKAGRSKDNPLAFLGLK
jgi:hypothetical protein